MMRDGRDKDQKLAEEADGQRHTGERSHRDQHGKGEKGRTFSEPVKIRDLFARLLCHNDEHGEAEHGHEQVANEVEGDGAPVETDDADEQIASVRDAGIGEQPLEVALGQRGQVAIEEGEQRDGHEQLLDPWHHHEGLERSQQHDEPRGLGTDREKSGHGSGRALIDVRNPDLKGDGCDLKTKSDQDQHDAEQGRALFHALPGEGDTDSLQVGLTRRSENPGNPVNEEPGGERAQHQILHARLEAERIAARKTDEHVERNGDQLERHENHDEIDGGRHVHETGTGKDRDREELAQPGLLRVRRHEMTQDRLVIDHHDEHENGGEQGKAFEENSERIGRVELPKAGGMRIRFDRREKEAGHEDGGERSDGGKSEVPFFEPIKERLAHQDDDAEDKHGDFKTGCRHHRGGGALK